MSLDQTSFDPGLTEKYVGVLNRAIEKDGAFNVRKSGRDLKDFHFYQYLINVSWPGFFLLIVAGYFLVNAIFASLYLMAGAGGIPGSTVRFGIPEFTSAFFLSLHAMTTAGFGAGGSGGFWENIVAAFDGLTGLIGLALATGLVYGRFSRPTSKISFSERAIVAPYRGKSSLQFRIANRRTNTLMELEAKVLLMKVSGNSGNHRREYHNLSLERPSVYFLPLTWTIVHPIDEKSPLFGRTAADLADSQTEILILIKAFDDTFGQVVHTRYSYRFDEITWGANFLPAFSITEKGDMSLELDRLSEMEIIGT